MIVFRCRGLTNQPATQANFRLADGRELSVAQYWHEKYGDLRYPWLPCLDVSKGGRITYLPMEVCEVAPGQRIPNLTPTITSAMIRYTAQRPEHRMQQISDTRLMANIDNDPAAQAFGIQVHDQPMRVDMCAHHFD